MGRKKDREKVHPFLKTAAFLILLMAMSFFMESFKNWDMVCDMWDIAHEHLEEAEVRLKSKDGENWYFVLSSPELESLTEEEWNALYEATNLEHMKVIDYICNGDVYYSADAVMQEEGKCEAFFEMPSDEMPLSPEARGRYRGEG